MAGLPAARATCAHAKGRPGTERYPVSERPEGIALEGPRPNAMTLDCIVSAPLLTARPDRDVQEVAATMADADAGAVLVVDGDQELLGIFTRHDLMRRVLLQGRMASHTQLRQVMTCPVETAPFTMSPAMALKKMLQCSVSYLPILDEYCKPLGILGIRELSLWLLREQKDKLNVMAGFATSGGPG